MAAPSFSCEFFPPRSTEAATKLNATSQALATLRPDFFSVTFGAGGSTRELTLETVLAMRGATGIDTAPHISCLGLSRAQLREIIGRYRAEGIRRLVVLRGDLPSGTASFGEFRYASELVRFIRDESGDIFHIEVAAYPEFHPQASSAHADLQNFKRKVDAGADSAITQYFFNADAYFRFVDSCRRLGVMIPIVPGIMPITNFTQLSRFSEMCGAEIPRWIEKRLRDFGDDRNSIRQFGNDVIVDLCARLLAGGAPGLHFYTMNQAEVATTVFQHIGLGDARCAIDHGARS
jgi:methylenetetrahydrofolate reductase (NADPH)